MNYSLTILEIAVVVSGLGLLLLDFWTPAEMKRQLGYAAAAVLGFLLLFSFSSHVDPGIRATAFNDMYVQDGLALFFKRLFLLAAIGVLILSVEFADRISTGISEYYALILFALAGMMFAASANDFALLFVSVELITVTFYVLTSFQLGHRRSIEAGVKYLILGALSSAFLVFGIALVFGTTGTMKFTELTLATSGFGSNKVFILGLLMVLAGLTFKIGAFPFQVWAPDVYQGSPLPTTAFLAIGSKAAGFVLLLRFLFSAVPDISAQWVVLLAVVSAVTILYGNLCAIPQRNLKRLLGYSSIANAGYLLLGVAALSHAGQSAVLYYLGAYLFTVLSAFIVICMVARNVDGEDLSALAGLNHRSPFLAVAMTLAMVSLAGIPPLAGFFGKFLLLKAAIEQGPLNPAYYWLVGVMIVGVVISLYYYFGVIRVIYWSQSPADLSPITLSPPIKSALALCVAGMFLLGLFPNRLMKAADHAVASLSVPAAPARAPAAPAFAAGNR